MAIAIVAHAIASNATNTATTTGVTTTGATALLTAVSTFANAILLGSDMADSNTNVWYQVGLPQPSGNARLTFFLAASPTVGSAHTVTVTTPNLAPSVAFVALSGCGPTSFWGTQASTAVSSGATSLAAGSLTPGVNNAIVIAALACSAAISSLSIGGGFTMLDSVPSGPGEILAIAYLIQTTATAANPTWSWTGSSACAAALTYLVPPGSGGGGGGTVGYGFAG